LFAEKKDAADAPPAPPSPSPDLLPGIVPELEPK
jgi:hypothetical protein